MAYAGWTKGSSALLAAIRAFAMAEDVDSALLAEWKISQPDVPSRSERAFTDNARKAWSFVGEMEEIARYLAGAGLPAGFHEAAREIYERLSGYTDTKSADGGGGRPEAAQARLSAGVGGTCAPWNQESSGPRSPSSRRPAPTRRFIDEAQGKHTPAWGHRGNRR
jgi:uncharacterized protein DUF1932